MKLKNIFLVFVLGTIWGFSSCSSEEVIDIPENGEATLSISLSVNDIQTKADESKSISTSDELAINNCHIAVFDMDGKYLTSYDFPEEGEMLTTGENGVCVLASSKTIRTFGQSKKVKFLAIANMDEKMNKETISFRGCATYDKYLKAVVTSTSLNANNLVKVGVLKDMKLTNGANNISITIPLTQLTARIDFGGIVIVGDNSRNVIETASGTGSISGKFMTKNELGEAKMENLLKAGDTTFDGNIGWSAQWTDFDDGVYGFGFKKSRGSFYSRFVGVRFTKTELSSTTGDFEIASIDGFNKKSDIGIWNVESLENQQYEALNGEIQGNIFYTYEVGTLDKSLTVRRSSSSSQKTSVAYGFIKQDRDYFGNFSPTLSGDYSKMTIYNLEGKSKQGFDHLKWTEETAATKASDKDKKDTYTLDLSNYTFIKGKRYTIKGTYNPTVSAEIDWVVQDWSSKENINIGFN